ncbi:MAG: serine hydrolase [Bacteroidota bacterium]
MKLFICVLGCLLISLSGAGQQFNLKEKTETIDSLLSIKGNKPGYALGLVKNDELVYSKGYGNANLDYNIPISDSTAFYIGSMAKQFTAAALLILQQEGKLDFKKEIIHYLPDFPKYDDDITVEHLVHHTSGIRETNSLQLFQGVNVKFEEVFTTDDLYQLIKKQKELNFIPGTEYRYSSGGYAVLAKIVEKVSNQPFRTFLRERIFKPLKMENTFVCDNHNEVVPNRAVSYWPIENGGYERRNQVFDAYGDGGIITTVQDLAKWDTAFYHDVLGVSDFSNKMYKKGTLQNGNTIDYALALNVWGYKGKQVVQHNGGMLGFRVDMVRFPDEKVTIILLGNSAYLNPTGDALKIADVLLEGTFDKERPQESSEPREYVKDVQVPKSISEARVGYYWTDETNYYRRISFQNDSLFLDAGNILERSYLKAISQNEYVLHGSNGATRVLFQTENDKPSLNIHFGTVKRSFRKFDAAPPQSLEELDKYVGVYESEELGTTYTFFKHEDELYLKINRNTPTQVYPLETDSRMVWNGKKMLWIGFGEIKFDVDTETVKGFTIGDQRVSDVYFKKTK